eukprot:GHVT01099736.1.p1 GENE.GHVT01099736.1~~GHVT01099736.1.p1  ORF type:complete len:156 (-),score=34.72 GHVT01099736.1:72-539(-)
MCRAWAHRGGACHEASACLICGCLAASRGGPPRLWRRPAAGRPRPPVKPWGADGPARGRGRAAELAGGGAAAAVDGRDPRLALSGKLRTRHLAHFSKRDDATPRQTSNAWAARAAEKPHANLKSNQPRAYALNGGTDARQKAPGKDEKHSAARAI